ncbi:MAG: AAA-like domain-containing protein [Nostoc sp. ChiQUE02]|uniref:AAA-like domain-containing protein n=1 Tax=Nostoc sp. ChiQUE02 TaxID=3075377 RepID=UPI002AD2CB19|nr:AAA-like domain-containing protein [Nostoc sp. ChiQUE02]MDZ8230316.1 AAA-like domain-containing protein [Nostoc sp. ChiQUE02]
MNSNISQSRKILILTAIPDGLRLDKEIREIEDAIRRAIRREQFEIKIRTAVRPQDIRRAIAEEYPHIVHFCGHGTSDGCLVLEDDGGNHKPVPPQGLAALFKLHAEYVNCVVLNACYSEKPAYAISQHINYAIGMNQPIGDKAAIVFAVGFYDGLGYANLNNQDNFQRAYDEGLVAIQMEDLTSGSIPVLNKKLPAAESPHPSYLTNTPCTSELKYPLEYPDGHVPLSSTFYVEHDGIESLCYETLVKPGSLIRIKAPKLMGKTSLLARIIAHGSLQNYQEIYLDLGSIDKAVLTSLDRFLRWLCSKVSSELDLENKVDDAWNTKILGSNDNCTAYFNKYILTQIDSPLVLALDEVDRLFAHSKVVEDFFGMLRSWHEKGKISDVWKKLRLVLAHSTEVYIPLDIHQSPFNAGVPVELEEFSQEQVQDLAQKHGLKRKNTRIEELRSMVGGHPYLVRLAMYHIAAEKVSLTDLLESATTEAGIYANHLRSLQDILQPVPELAQALKKVVNSTVPVELNSMQIYKLHSLGLVHRQGNHVVPRCHLYREYFRRVL